MNYRRKQFCSRLCGLAYHKRPEIVEARFWPKVRKTEGCWFYTGTVLNSGYGEFGRKPRILAHRYSYQLANGEIPKGKLVLHKCDTPLCVRPDHLFLGTDKDNKQDCLAKNRIVAKLSPEAVREIRRAFANVTKKLPPGSYDPFVAKYKVSSRTIWAAWKGVKWKHVT